ncbi:Rho-associated protein kinase 2, partial [Geodia barretti]
NKTVQSLKQELLVEKGDRDQLQSRLTSQQKDLSSLERQLHEARTEVEKMRKMKKTAEDKLSELNRVSRGQEEELSSMTVRLTESTEEVTRIKKMSSQLEREKTQTDLSLKNLQQTHDDLKRRYDDIVDQLKADREKTSDSKSKENSDLLAKLETEAAAHKAARERAEKAESQVSMATLDLKTTQEEARQKQQEVTSLQTKLQALQVETRRRLQSVSDSKRDTEKRVEELQVRERELMEQVSSTTAEKHRLEDTICRLKSEAMASATSVSEAMELLEREKETAAAARSELEQATKAAELAQKNQTTEKEIGQLKAVVDSLHKKLEKALMGKTVAESKLADFEREKKMIELDIQEILVRHKSDVTERMSKFARLEESLVLTQRKLDQKNHENEVFQDNLKQALQQLEERGGHGEELQDKINSLEKELKFMEVKKNEAINKLAQVMFSRTPDRGGSSQQSSGSRRQDREIRKLRGELQHETQKFQNMVRKYQKELEDVSNKIAEEQQLRQDLQVKLIQSEQQLATLKTSLSNGPTMELIDSPAHSDIVSPIVERVTCRLQIPKGHNPRKQGWKEVFMVMSFTNKQLAVYEDEDSLQTKDPLMVYQFSQIYTVRTLNPGEHEILRVKQSDLKKILMLSYIEDGGSAAVALDSSTAVYLQPDQGELKTVRGHQFVEINYHTPSNCDVCSKTLPWSLNIMRRGECSYECQRCHLKCHKEHTERNVEAMQPCVGGEQNIKRQLLLIKDSEELERWYAQLSRITLNSSSSDSASQIPLL